jgi:hypothetical protein
LLLRNADEFLVLGAAGTVLISPDGSRRPIRTHQEHLPADQRGGHVLVDHTGQFIALSG